MMHFDAGVSEGAEALGWNDATAFAEEATMNVSKATLFHRRETGGPFSAEMKHSNLGAFRPRALVIGVRRRLVLRRFRNDRISCFFDYIEARFPPARGKVRRLRRSAYDFAKREPKDRFRREPLARGKQKVIVS
jgi:hypothetical protein